MKRRDLIDFESGIWVQRLEYKSFTPNSITLQWILTDPDLQHLLDEANRHLGRLDAFSELVPDVDFFIKMHITKEATVSSKIEGTQTSFQEALIRVEDVDPEKRDDWKEVHNYIDATNLAIEEMGKLPISNRLIRQTHRILLRDSRGSGKNPGEYRHSQNWIGNSLKHAIFVPPSHEEIPDLMHDLERFVNAEELELPLIVPHLIKIAIIHYQFETIHPFLDGNGRIGRLLITLYLISKKLINRPTLYLSDFFEKNRRDYYDHLNRVRTHNDLVAWIRFFLEGIIETALNSIATFQHIIQLRDDVERNKLLTLGRRQPVAQLLINALYRQPILSGVQIANVLDKHPSNANKLIADLVRLEILQELTGYSRNRLYAFQPYIDLFG
ncbi:MAG TPA: Fic family protein [Saprospiraceae bacterium]|nr:Fic family protein [Saprospiraceae bacterium]